MQQTHTSRQSVNNLSSSWHGLLSTYIYDFIINLFSDTVISA